MMEQPSEDNDGRSFTDQTIWSCDETPQTLYGCRASVEYAELIEPVLFVNYTVMVSMSASIRTNARPNHNRRIYKQDMSIIFLSR